MGDDLKSTRRKFMKSAAVVGGALGLGSAAVVSKALAAESIEEILRQAVGRGVLEGLRGKKKVSLVTIYQGLGGTKAGATEEVLADLDKELGGKMPDVTALPDLIKKAKDRVLAKRFPGKNFGISGSCNN
ncbi:MAG: twin-arginine translocation signal domain-containing protein [Candidatus Tectomicrobia bacterium]|nr:twin-arginine translocation signal domain-containing protein [Candidatus Tectomicrobia bacterium]